MKRTAKRAITFFLTLAVIAAFTAGMTLSASALTLTENGMRFNELTETTVEFTGYTGSETEIVIPAECQGKKVVKIADNCFRYTGSNLTSVTISEGIEEIGSYAFYKKTALKTVVLPESLKSVGNYAFNGCTALSQLNIPSGLTSAGSSAFSATAITSAVVPASLKTVSFSMFDGCKQLSSVTIEEGIEKIEGYAFAGCTSLKSIDIPEGVTRIWMFAFKGCTSLESFSIPSTVTADSMGQSLFDGCTGLKSVYIPANLAKGGNNIFENCTSLTEAVFAEDCMAVGNKMFKNCTSLETVVLPDGMSSIRNEAFAGCAQLEKLTVPASVTSFGSGVFTACDNLTIYGWRNSPAQTYAASNSIPFVALDGSSVISVEPADGVLMPGTGEIKVVTKDDIWKLQFIFENGSAKTYQPGSSSIVSVTENGDGTKTWVVTAYFPQIGSQAVSVKARPANSAWEESAFSANLEVSPAEIYSAQATGLAVGSRFDLTVEVSSCAVKVQLLYADGSTRTYELKNAELLKEENGRSTYKLSSISCGSPAQTEFTVLVKAGAAWSADGVSVS